MIYAKTITQITVSNLYDQNQDYYALVNFIKPQNMKKEDIGIDFVGTALAEISTKFSLHGNLLEQIGRHFNIEESKLTVIGISIYGTENFEISLICVDKEKSTSEEEHIVKMLLDIPNQSQILKTLFRKLYIEFYAKHDEHYSKITNRQEIKYSDYHTKQ